MSRSEVPSRQATVPIDRPRLLVADDCAETRRIVRAAVGSSYSEVIEVEDGRRLFWSLVRAYYAEPEPAHLNLVVVADILMPGYDGLEVLEAWQEFEAPVPIVVITNYADDRVRARVTKLGGRLLAKPFSLRDLRFVLGQLASLT